MNMNLLWGIGILALLIVILSKMIRASVLTMVLVGVPIFLILIGIVVITLNGVT